MDVECIILSGQFVPIDWEESGGTYWKKIGGSIPKKLVRFNWEEFGGRIVRKPHRESSTGIQGEGITVNKG